MVIGYSCTQLLSTQNLEEKKIYFYRFQKSFRSSNFQWRISNTKIEIKVIILFHKNESIFNVKVKRFILVLEYYRFLWLGTSYQISIITDILYTINMNIILFCDNLYVT